MVSPHRRAMWEREKPLQHSLNLRTWSLPAVLLALANPLWAQATRSGHTGEKCTLTVGMSPAAVEGTLGRPDWKQSQAWDYYNAGVEVIFQDDHLYAVRFMIGTPFLPLLLTTSNLIPGSPRTHVEGLGPAVDHDSSKWVTDLYTDNRTFGLAANYSPINGTLENVLLRQPRYTVYCAPESGPGSRAMFRAWYKLGATIDGIMRSHASKSQSAVNRSRADVEKGLREVHLGTTSVAEAPFRCCNPDPAVPAATLRDLLLALAAKSGRDSGTATPTIALYTGMYLSLEQSLPEGSPIANSPGGHEDMLNHFAGTTIAAYPDPPASIEPQLNALLSALRIDAPNSTVSAAVSQLAAAFFAD